MANDPGSIPHMLIPVTMGLGGSQIKAILRELGCTDMTELKKSWEFDFGKKCAEALKGDDANV
jgi:hypothetical protein